MIVAGTLGALKTLLYLIYGNQRAYHLELTHSVLSVARFLERDPSGIQIALICDAQNQRPDLPVEHIVIAPELLHEWQLSGSYHHAAKVFALQHALNHFGEAVALIDSDTIIQQHPTQLFDRIGPGRSLLHTSEGAISGSKEWPELAQLIEKTSGMLGNWPITAQTVMHNSGVFGLHPTDTALLDEVVTVIRAIQASSTVFTAEQLAASIVLTDRTEVSHCSDIVDHYWDGPRDYYHYQMERFYPDVMQGGGILPGKPELKPLQDIPAHSLTDRILARVKQFRRGNDPEYGFAYLAYRSALSVSAKDKMLADIWSRMAVEMLSHAVTRQHPEAGDDFAAFRTDKLAQHGWLTEKTRARWQAYWAD